MADVPTTCSRGGGRTNFDENRHTAGYSSDQEVTNAATILCEVSGSNLGQQSAVEKGASESSSSCGQQPTPTEEQVSERRTSRRKRKPVRRLSLSTLEEEPGEDAYTDGGQVTAPSSSKPRRVPNVKVPSTTRGQNASRSFTCDFCKSNFIIPPRKRKGAARRSWRVSVRYWVDPETSKKYKLCNACGLRASRNRNPASKRPEKATQEEKDKYYNHVQKFSQSLVSELKDPDAERLTCPYFRTRTPCACIQKFIVGDGNQIEEAKKRAAQLLQLVKEAQRLRGQKFYDVEEIMKKAKKHRKVGIGNGQRKSREYEELVLNKRALLKDELKFCEHAAKRILLYSNNFLHKRLKSDPVKKRRLERNYRKTLKDITELPDEPCCEEQCVLLAQTHKVLLQKWRDRAKTGQTEARMVLAEMLTPSGLKTNCHKFITMVTGCSTTTIIRVEEQIRTTGGDRDPPPHGLKKYWEQQPRAAARKPSTAAKATNDPITASTSGMAGQGNLPAVQPGLSEKQLKDQLLHLQKLQGQLTAQQNRLNQQQRTIEKQLSLMNKQKEDMNRNQVTQYRTIQPALLTPVQASREVIGIAPMATPGDIDSNTQQNMNQLLLEIGNQIANQQIQQQQLMNGNPTGRGTVADLDQPPPSYNVAVALSNNSTLTQGVQGLPGQVILQALPITCGDTITICPQPIDTGTASSGGRGNASLGIVTQNDPSEGSDQQGPSVGQSFLVSIPDIIEVDSLDQEVMPDVIEVHGTTAQFSTDAPFAEDLQMTTQPPQLTSSSVIPTQQSLLSDLEETISRMTPSAPHPRSTAAILRRRPRNIAPAVASTRVPISPRFIMRAANESRPISELPGDMLMPCDPLQALTATNQNLVLQSLPATSTTGN